MKKLTSVININVPTEIKEDCSSIFNNLGLDMNTAINIFLKRVSYERGIPFDLKETKPSIEMLEALNELDYMEKHPEEYKSYSNIEELKKDLLSNY